jgi:hypothetical protein
MTFLRSMLSDSHNDSWSSKRVITLLAFFMCSAAFIGSVFFGKIVDPALFDSMMYIVVAGLGFTASEKFASHKKY